MASAAPRHSRRRRAGTRHRRRRRGARPIVGARLPRPRRRAAGPGRPRDAGHQGSRRRPTASTVTEATDPAVFTAASLARYRAVVFLSATGAALSRDQETALQNYVKAGGGFLGIADAAKAQADSAWFTGLIGTRPAGGFPSRRARVRGDRERGEPAERDQGEADRRRPGHQVARPSPRPAGSRIELSTPDRRSPATRSPPPTTRPAGTRRTGPCRDPRTARPGPTWTAGPARPSRSGSRPAGSTSPRHGSTSTSA